jgi:hypothetical protein
MFNSIVFSPILFGLASYLSRLGLTYLLRKNSKIGSFGQLNSTLITLSVSLIILSGFLGWFTLGQLIIAITTDLILENMRNLAMEGVKFFQTKPPDSFMGQRLEEKDKLLWPGTTKYLRLVFGLALIITIFYLGFLVFIFYLAG